MKKALAVALVALVAGTSVAAAASRYTVDVRRTAYGVPHVLAKDFGSLGYGEGYAFAQDNLCAMADRVLTLRGQRSKYFGATATIQEPLGGGTTNLASDTYYGGVQKSGNVQRLLAQPAPLGPTVQMRQIVDGYVEGYNRYLRDTGVAHIADPTCRGAAWVTPITTTDVWTGINDIGLLEGTLGFEDDIAAATPPSPGKSAAVPVSRAPKAGEIGSNAWALGRDVTAGHDGMLLVNPHMPWLGHGRFSQLQLTIPGVLNVTGAALFGTPVVEVGHTDGVAFTGTISTAQRYVLYQLKLVPGDPTSYLVDGKAERMTEQTVPVTVRDDHGQLSTVDKKLYSSRYGPVVGTGWTTTTAFAVKDVNAGNLRSTNEWLAMDQAHNLDQLRAAQNAYQGIPWSYTIATDAGGSAYIADASVVPHLTDAEAARCRVGTEGALDGSTSSCALGSDRDAIVPGIFGPSAYPRQTRTDYEANSNSSMWLSNANAPITGYPAVFGDTGTARNLRTRLGVDMIDQRVNGTDGLGAPGFTLPTLQATMLGNRSESVDLARDDVLALCRAHPVLTATDGHRVDVRQACAVLASWTGRFDVDSRGAALWQAFWFAMSNRSPSQGWWKVPFDPANPLTTPRGIDAGNAIAQHGLADAVATFQAKHVALDVTLGATQHYATAPVPGCGGETGCFDAVDAYGDGTGGDVRFGSSFIMAVELTRNGPRAGTILTYSQSTDPTSPHYTDQTALFAAKQWVPDRFTEAEINADPRLRTTCLHG